mgnify:CR=1 FL=1
MKVLITGGCGFLGQMIAKAILAGRYSEGSVVTVDLNAEQLRLT